MCFEAHQAITKAHAVFDQGMGFETGEGREFVILWWHFLTYML